MSESRTIILTEPLADPRLEAVVQILRPWLTADNECELRWNVTGAPDDALATLSEARRQTGADALAAALKARMGAGTDAEIIAASDLTIAALVTYERIAKDG